MAIPTDVQDALDRLSGGYNNGDYNAGTNPLGFSNGGHRINLYALTADVTLVGLWTNDQVASIIDISSDIEAVATVAADVTTVAEALADVSIVAGIAANVSVVAGDSSEINALAAITAAVSQVAAIVSAVSTVAARDAAIATVAARDTAIGVVAARDAAIGVVAARDADIGTVAGIASAVSAVAADGVDIGVVAANIADVGVAADNIVAIQGASGNAAAAITARNEAEGFAEAGKHLTLFWAYSTTLTDANPGAGVFRLNNAAPGAATLLFISLTEAEGGDATAWLDSWDDSTTTANRGTITLVSATNPGTWVKYRVIGATTSATGYRKVAIAHLASAGALGPSDEFGIQFVRSGDRGADGLGTGTVVDNGPVTEGHFAAYADNTGVSIEDSGKGPSDMVERANNGADFSDAHSTFDNLSKLGVNIASAATINLDAATGIALAITGTTATSQITLGAGKWRLVRAAGAWPITVGANLTLNNGGSNYVCAPGDRVLFVSEGTIVRGTVFPISGRMPGVAFTGDSGSGGVLGSVPAPAAGDAAANKVLGAGGGWITPPVCAGGDNPVLNPDHEILQNAASVAAAPDGTEVTDRWVYNKTGAVVHTVSRDTDVPTIAQQIAAGIKEPRLLRYSFRATLTTPDNSLDAGDHVVIVQKLEGTRFRPFAQRTRKGGAWFKATVAGTFSISFRNGLSDLGACVPITINAPNAWEWKIFDIPATPAAGTWTYDNSGAGLRLGIVLSAGSTYQVANYNTWYSGAGVHAVAGQTNFCASGSTDFRFTGFEIFDADVGLNQPRYFEEELRLCRRIRRRYTAMPDNAYVLQGVALAGNAAQFLAPSDMRALTAATYSGTPKIREEGTGSSGITSLSVVAGAVEGASTIYASCGGGLTAGKTVYLAMSGAADFIDLASVF